MQHVKPLTEGFVLLRYQAADGSSGEQLFETDDPEALFNTTRKAMVMDGNAPAPKNQLTLCLDPVKVEQQRGHTFK
jgi:hypothetical protein